MAWTAPRTWVTGELVTSTMLNSAIRDNLLAINSVPAARVYNSSTQGAIAANAFSTINFNSERYDTDAIHDTVTNSSRLTCKTAGKYLIQVSYRLSTTVAAAVKTVEVLLNGATAIALREYAATTGELIDVLSTEYQLAVNDYVEPFFHPGTATDLFLTAVAAYAPEWMMHRLSD